MDEHASTQLRLTSLSRPILQCTAWARSMSWCTVLMLLAPFLCCSAQLVSPAFTTLFPDTPNSRLSMSTGRAAQPEAERGRPGAAAGTSRPMGRVKKRARSPTASSPTAVRCTRQLRRTTIDQRMKIKQKNSTKGNSLFSTNVMDSNIRDSNVVFEKHLTRRSVRPTSFKRGIEDDETAHVQKCILLEELGCLPQSSKYDFSNQDDDDVPNKTVIGPKHKRCQARKRKKEQSSRVCKVRDMTTKPSRVIQKRIQYLKASNVCLESDTASSDIEKGGISNVPEVPSKTESLELSCHPKHFAWQCTCHKTTTGIKKNSTNVTRTLSDIRAVEPSTNFQPVNAIVLHEPKILYESWEQKMNEHTHSKTCVSQFNCARTTPISLDTCARIRPFRRSKLCTKFWFGSAWFCKREEMGEWHCDAKSGVVSYRGLHQENFESVENVVYLLSMLSLGVPELKQIIKDNSQEKAILKNGCNCASFEQDQISKLEPPVHPLISKECCRELEGTHDIPNCSKIANCVTEGIKCPIWKSELNLISLSAHYVETLALQKRQELHVTLCNGSEGKAALNCQGHKTVWNKSTLSKGCLEQINSVQPVAIHVYQNEFAGLRCTQLNVQSHLEPSKQAESEGFNAVFPLLASENKSKSERVGVNDHSLSMSLCPDGNYKIEKPLHSPWKERAQRSTSSLEDLQILKSLKKPFVVIQAREDKVSHCEKKHFVQEMPDIVKAYKEDALVLDVIQDDLELFGSPSNTSVMQEEADCTELEIKSVDGKLANELTSIQQEGLDPKISSAYLYQYEEDTCGNLSNCTNLQQDKVKTESRIPLSKEHNFKEDTQVETFVNEEELIESGDSMCQVLSSTTSVLEIAEQQNDKESKTSVSSFEDHCVCRPTLENNFSLKPPLESSVGKSVLTNLKLTHEYLLPPTSRAAASMQLNSSKYVTVTRGLNYPLELIALPPGYCKFYFTAVRGCKTKQCRFEHDVKNGDEKFCIEIVQKFMETGNLYLFLRAARIFRNYYRNFQPGIYYSYQVMNRLLFTLWKLQRCQDLLELLNLAINMNVLPDAEILPNVFDLVASTDWRAMVPDLITITCKLVEAGIKFHLDQLNYMIHVLNQLRASHQEIDLIMGLKARLLSQQSEAEAVFDLNFALAEIEQYKEKGEWNRMGILFQSVLQNHNTQSELHTIATCIAIALVTSKDNGAAVPFCEFAKTVHHKSHVNGMANKLIGRIGTSVLVAFYKSEKWRKGRKVLDTLQEIQANFTILKGLVSEYTASRCQIINVAGEIFIKTGCVTRALWLLRESNWITSSLAWPCDNLDILNRHNFLFSLADVTLKNNMYCETLEVLQHLPGLQKVNGLLDVTPYVGIFNNLLDQCIQNNCLGASSDTVEFMRSLNISINPLAVRNLITALGRSNLWLKARNQYKKAFSSGCYPPIQENLYRKLLPIPCFLSEVEMLLATEMFLVTNASNIQSPSLSKHCLQIVLRRYEDEGSFTNGGYEAAVDRLLAAARISEPKLQIKHTTVNIAKEEIFSLEYSSALRWLQQNMKWAGKVWLFD